MKDLLNNGFQPVSEAELVMVEGGYDCDCDCPWCGGDDDPDTGTPLPLPPWNPPNDGNDGGFKPIIPFPGGGGLGPLPGGGIGIYIPL